MKKKKTILTIIAALFLMIFVSCSDINPFFAGGVLPGGNWIYFAEGSNIKKMRLDGSEVENVFDTGYGDIARLQLDPLGQKIYILEQTSNTTNKIYEYNLDGTQQKLIVDKGNNDIYDIEIDTVSGILYYANSTQIIQLNLKTKASLSLFTGAFGSPFSMSYDKSDSIYYTYGASLYKLNISTQSSNQIPVNPSLGAPGGVAINSENQYLYVYDGQMILKINLSNSTSVSILNNASIFHEKNMEVSTIETKLFFYQNTAPYALYNINFDGSNLNKIYETNNWIGGFDILSK